MRADQAKNHRKIVKDVLLDPLKSQRERADDLWVWKTTIQEHMQTIKTTKDDRIIGLTDEDFRMMQKIQGRKFARLDDLDTPVNDTDLNNWDREAKARYSLFRWSATDEDGWLKNIDNVEIN